MAIITSNYSVLINDSYPLLEVCCCEYFGVDMIPSKYNNSIADTNADIDTDNFWSLSVFVVFPFELFC